MSGAPKRDRILRIIGAVVVAISLIPLVGAAVAAGSNEATDSSLIAQDLSVTVTPPAPTPPVESPGDATNEGGPIEGSTNPDARVGDPIDGTELPGDSQVVGDTEVLGTKQGSTTAVAGGAGGLLAGGLALLVAGLVLLLVPSVIGRSHTNDV